MEPNDHNLDDKLRDSFGKKPLRSAPPRLWEQIKQSLPDNSDNPLDNKLKESFEQQPIKKTPPAFVWDKIQENIDAADDSALDNKLKESLEQQNPNKKAPAHLWQKIEQDLGKNLDDKVKDSFAALTQKTAPEHVWHKVGKQLTIDKAWVLIAKELEKWRKRAMWHRRWRNTGIAATVALLLWWNGCQPGTMPWGNNNQQQQQQQPKNQQISQPVASLGNQNDLSPIAFGLGKQQQPTTIMGKGKGGKTGLFALRPQQQQTNSINKAPALGLKQVLLKPLFSAAKPTKKGGEGFLPQTPIFLFGINSNVGKRASSLSERQIAMLNNWQSTDNQQPTIDNQQSTTNNQQPTIALLPIETLSLDSLPLGAEEEYVTDYKAKKTKQLPALEVGLVCEVGSQILANTETQVSLRTNSLSKTTFKAATSYGVRVAWNFTPKHAISLHFLPQNTVRQNYYFYDNGHYTEKRVRMSYMKWVLSYQQHFGGSETGMLLTRIGAYVSYLQQRQEFYETSKQAWALDNTQLYRRWDWGMRAALGYRFVYRHWVLEAGIQAEMGLQNIFAGDDFMPSYFNRTHLIGFGGFVGLNYRF